MHVQKPKGHESLLPSVTISESDTQSVLAENNFYKTSDHLLKKERIP